MPQRSPKRNAVPSQIPTDSPSTIPLLNYGALSEGGPTPSSASNISDAIQQLTRSHQERQRIQAEIARLGVPKNAVAEAFKELKKSLNSWNGQNGGYPLCDAQQIESWVHGLLNFVHALKTHGFESFLDSEFVDCPHFNLVRDLLMLARSNKGGTIFGTLEQLAANASYEVVPTHNRIIELQQDFEQYYQQSDDGRDLTELWRSLQTMDAVINPNAAVRAERIGEREKSLADPYADLRQFAHDKLKGQERAVIEALCGKGGEMRLPDLAIEPGVGWDDPCQGFRNLQQRLNPKLKPHHWTLVRQNNAAKLHPIKLES